jgi:hypothetical protein
VWIASTLTLFIIFSVPSLEQLFRVTAATPGDTAFAVVVGIVAIAWRVVASSSAVARIVLVLGRDD